jgi:phage minor structural protein
MGETETRVIPSRTITEQLFRIKDVQVDRDNGKVTVSGVHVSYDLKGNLVNDLTIGQASPAMAIGRITENLMMEYRGMIATDMTDTSAGTFTGSFKRKNGMFCLTDPDTGVVAAFNAKFTRDNWDLFVMENTDTDRGYRIRYAKNVNGIQWREKTDGLVTRVVPVAKDANGNDLLLPEVYVDSDHISDYPVIYMETLTVTGQVGKDDGSGTNTVWTESALLDEMRAKARERFTIDKADVPLKEVTVQLQQLENTAEYAWMQDLLKVLLYDIVTVSDPEIGKSEQLKATEIEWDYIQKKITGLKLSNVENSVTRSVTGYNVSNKSIGSEKLKDEVIDEIRSLAVDTSVEEASQRIPGLQANTKDYDGVVTKGSGHAGKVWKTDADGNPDWRDDSPGSQSPDLPDPEREQSA